LDLRGRKWQETGEDYIRRSFIKLHYLHASPNNIRVIKSRRMQWTGHVASMEEMRKACHILVGKAEGTTSL
jgi:hypothetical protein